MDTLKELYDYVTNLEINGAESTIAGIVIEGKPLEIVDKFINIEKKIDDIICLNYKMRCFYG